MPIHRAEVAQTLSMQSPTALLAVLEAAAVPVRGADTAPELAARIADALWWYYCTPLGYVVDRTDLGDIVDHVAKKTGVEGLPHVEPWARLRELTARLVGMHDPVALEDIDPKTRERLWPNHWPTAFAGMGAGSSAGAAVVGRGILKLAATPIGRVLPLIPTVGPWFKAIKVGAGAAAAVGGPLAVGLTVVATNNAMGTNYRRLVPLLLGVGALGPQPIDDAVEIDEPTPDEPARAEPQVSAQQGPTQSQDS